MNNKTKDDINDIRRRSGLEEILIEDQKEIMNMQERILGLFRNANDVFVYKNNRNSYRVEIIMRIPHSDVSPYLSFLKVKDFKRIERRIILGSGIKNITGIELEGIGPESSETLILIYRLTISAI